MPKRLLLKTKQKKYRWYTGGRYNKHQGEFMDPNTPTPTPTPTPPQQPQEAPFSQAPQTPEAPVSAQPSAPEKRPKNKLLVIVGAVVLGLLALFAVLYFFVFSATSGATKVSDKFVAAIQKNDAAAAYALTSDAFKEATTQTEVESIFASISDALQGTTTNNDRKVESRNGKTYSAIVYTVKTKDAGDKYIRVVLEKVGNDWKVINFRSSASKLDATIE
jgi:hypothetical protein